MDGKRAISLAHILSMWLISWSYFLISGVFFSSKICDSFIYFLTFGPHIWPHILSSHPINYHFTFVTLHYACSNEKFDSMYGWYGCNFSNRWKIAIFVWFWLIFGTFGAHIWPHILFSHPINDHLIFGTLHYACAGEKFNWM